MKKALIWLTDDTEYDVYAELFLDVYTHSTPDSPIVERNSIQYNTPNEVWEAFYSNDDYEDPTFTPYPANPLIAR